MGPRDRRSLRPLGSYLILVANEGWLLDTRDRVCIDSDGWGYLTAAAPTTPRLVGGASTLTA